MKKYLVVFNMHVINRRFAAVGGTSSTVNLTVQLTYLSYEGVLKHCIEHAGKTFPDDLFIAAVGPILNIIPLDN